MPDQHDRAVDGLDHVADDAGVEADPSQRIRRGERRVASALELADHSCEPGRVSEGAVDEDDGGTRHGVLLRVEEVTPMTLRHRTQASRPRGCAGPDVGIVPGTEGPGGRWLLLHGTLPTPQIWDGGSCP